MNLKTIKKINNSQTSLENNPLFIKICRILSFYFTILFLKVNFSSKNVTYLNLVFGFFVFYFFVKSKIFYFNIAIGILFLIYIFDCVDGNIARINKKPTFHGRFIDGLFGIIINSLLLLGLSIYCKNFFVNENLFFIGLISACVSPFGHFIFDKYSALARWQNSISKKKIKPYIWRTNNKKIILIIKDLQYFTLILSPIIFFFYITEFIFYYFFISNILVDIYMIILHVRESSRKMNIYASDYRK